MNIMYVEILHQVVQEILTMEGAKKQPIIVELTPFLYDTLQYELNHICKFNTTVPIESVNFTSVNLYGRTITLSKGSTLNSIFERQLVAKLALVNIK